MSLIGINDINVFNPDTAAEAQKVNDNFNAIKNAHNDTDSKVSTMQTTLSSGIILPDGSVDFTRLQSYKSRTITNATNATPIVVTSTGHKFVSSDTVTISGVQGNTAANGTFTITKIDDDTFSLDGSVGNGTYSSGGIALLTPVNDNNLVNLGYLKANAGALKINALGTISSNITLPVNSVTTADVTGAISITLPTTLVSGNENTVIFDFSATSTSLTINQTATTKAITAASNASPIQITAVGHGYNTGDKINISGVQGNTAANGTWIITRLTADTFTLNGSTGNGAYTSGGTCTLSNIKWSNNNGGKAPTSYSIASGVRNILIFKTHDNGTNWEAEYSTYGGVETAFPVPTLSSDGTLGGSSFAVYSSTIYSSGGRPAYYAFDGNSGTLYTSGNLACSFIIYNPTALKMSDWSFVAEVTNRQIASYVIYGSNDNLIYTVLNSGTNTSVTTNLTLTIPESNRGYYKYYKLYVSSVLSDSLMSFYSMSFNATYIAN